MSFLDNLGQSFGNMTNDPRQMGLLMAAAQMMAQSGPSNRPVGFGEIMGGGLSTFLNTRNGMQQQQAEAAEREQMQQYRGAQMQGMQLEQEKARAALARSMEVQQAIKDYKSPRAQALSKMNGPTQANAEQLSQLPQDGNLYNELMGLAQHLHSRGLTDEAIARAKQAQEVQAKYDRTPRVAKGPDGKPFTYVLDEMGNMKVLDGVLPRDEMKVEQLGGHAMAYNPFDLQHGQTFKKSMTTSDMVSMRGQNMTDARARETNAITRQGQQTQIVNDPTLGPILVDKGTGEARRATMNGQPVAGEAATKKEAAARGLVPVLTRAETLIDGATGSYFGAASDHAARAFGIGTSGDKNIAQLKVLEGQIMMNQPRMEGPQSNMDVQMYRQMAGQLGDPTVPTSIKKAALQTIRALNDKYSQQGGASADRSSGPSIDDLLNKYGGK